MPNETDNNEINLYFGGLTAEDLDEWTVTETEESDDPVDDTELPTG